MPDTGAPWNIPYVENADLVSDWPADSLLVANAVAAGLTAASVAGIGSNVVQTVKTDTFTTASTSYVDVTGLSVTITPSSATAKVLVSWAVTIGNTSALRNLYMRLTDGSNNVLVQGDAAGSREQVTNGVERLNVNVNNTIFSGSFLWSPASATAQTAKIRVRTSADTLVINRNGSDPDSSASPRQISTITAIEVAA